MGDTIFQKFQLKGAVAVVTGASKGIGAAIARGLAEAGASVVVSSRSAEAVAAVAADLQQAGCEATSIACHTGDPVQLQNLVDQTLSLYGGIDILVNNAAVNPVLGPICEADAGLFDKIMEINVKAPFLLSNLVFPSMKKRGGGSIIHISSIEGIKPGLGLGLYSLSKAALIMLMKNQAKEWGEWGIRVNALCPGLVKTKFSAAIWQNEAFLEKFVQNLPLGRVALPEEMAALALFLASSASAYVTGQAFVADGGYLISG